MEAEEEECHVHAPHSQGAAKCSCSAQNNVHGVPQINTPLSTPKLLFSPTGNLTPFKLKLLVHDMCVAPLDNTCWSKPLRFSRETLPAADTAAATTITSMCGLEAASKDAPGTDGSGSGRDGVAPAQCSTQYQPLIPGQPVPRSVPPPGRCRKTLRFVLISLWVLVAYKIVTDLPGAVREAVHWAAFDTMQDTERGLAGMPAPIVDHR